MGQVSLFLTQFCVFFGWPTRNRWSHWHGHDHFTSDILSWKTRDLPDLQYRREVADMVKRSLVQAQTTPGNSAGNSELRPIEIMSHFHRCQMPERRGHCISSCMGITVAYVDAHIRHGIPVQLNTPPTATDLDHHHL